MRARLHLKADRAKPIRESRINELGLDHNETHSWHRHVSLVMLAFAMMAAIRRQANTPAPPKSSLRMMHNSQR